MPALIGDTFRILIRIPRLCLQSTPNPPPPPPAPAPAPSTFNAVLDLSPKAPSNSTTSATMVSFNFDWHENDEEPPAWINCSALLLDVHDPMLQAAAKVRRSLRILVLHVRCCEVKPLDVTCAVMYLPCIVILIELLGIPLHCRPSVRHYFDSVVVKEMIYAMMCPAIIQHARPCSRTIPSCVSI